MFQPKDSFCGEALGDRYVNFDKLIVYRKQHILLYVLVSEL